jgi:hypothetical protein
MSPTANSMRPAGRRAALAGVLDQRRREVDGVDIGAAPRGLQRQHAGAAAGVEQALAAQVRRQPAEQVARISSRPARTVARMPLTGASEVKRFQASAAVRSK